MDKLLHNAVDSIRLGVEDHQAKDPARLLSAVRNLHSGVLLLFKEDLRRRSPPGSDDSLLKARVVPEMRDGKVVHVGVGKKTASQEQIEERFKALNVKVDWERFHRIAKIRHDVEHYFTDVREDTIRGVISDTFVVLREFITNEWEEEPVHVLDPASWETMLRESGVMERELAEREAAMSSTDWGSKIVASEVRGLRCATCGSPLLIPRVTVGDPELVCRSCGNAESREEYAERAVLGHFGREYDFTPDEHGDEPYVPFISCPFCDREAYLLEEQVCEACGQSCVHTCERCGLDIPASELSDGNLCGYCEHMSSKD